jgi:hypothetical protein
MTYGEWNHLNTFITNSPYFAYEHFIVVRDPTLPQEIFSQTSTCSKRLEIPWYDDVENMFFKLNLASLHKGYGLAEILWC